MTFSLLSLPSLALIQVFKGFDPVQIVCLSLCSRKATTFIKHLWKAPKNWNITIKVGCSLNMWVLAANDNEYVICAENANCYYRPGNPCKIQYPMNGKCCIDDIGNLDIFCEDRLLGFKKVTTHICEFFKANITEIELHGISGNWMVDWIKERQIGKLKNMLVFFKKETTKAEYNAIMSCDIAESMALLGEIPKDVIASEHLPPTKTLIIDNANWLTMDHLLAMQSEIFLCRYSELSNDYVNKFIRHWLDGGCPRLKYIATGQKYLAHQEMYQGVLERLERVENEITYAWDNAGQIEYIWFGPSDQCYNIRRDDGVVATTFLSERIFEMVVWPDALNENVV